ncbi:MAG TPA: cysteine desulfurase family protein [Candidatus Nitrosotenuis sp.]|nr:cysteine desulfurase family protein [Candidatus Nitrosotenuis sp.]
MSELKFPIYLDHHATTPVDPRVLEEMLPYFTEKFGNASSLDHTFGYDASVAVENAREQIAKAINARHDEIIFTSGATESDNLALIGTMEKYREKGNHLITCVTEHKAILDTARHLESRGYKVTYLPVNQYGEIDLELLEKSITDKTIMISIMAANNEIGTIADIAEIGRIAHEYNVFFHTDAAQAVGHIPVDVEKMQIDLMSFSAHKMYGPKGVGALYMRGIKPRIKLDPIIFGGGQERNIRSGTLNVPGIVGFGKALQISQREMNVENEKFKKWTRIMLDIFTEAGGLLNGHPIERLPHNLNVYFKGVESKAIINSVSDKIAISAGSACTTQMVEPSHVLLALGHDEERAHSSIRIGIGRFNTDEEIQYATNAILEAVKKIEKIKA